jgi:hypothetical protein
MIKHELSEDAQRVSKHVLQNTVGYIGINAYGWTKGKSISGVLENLHVHHNPKDKPNVPYRLFMIMELKGEYNVGSDVWIMGLSKNGYPSILIEDTHEK